MGVFGREPLETRCLPRKAFSSAREIASRRILVKDHHLGKTNVARDVSGFAKVVPAMRMCLQNFAGLWRCRLWQLEMVVEVPFSESETCGCVVMVLVNCFTPSR